ncbi:hypothetical protein B0O99DRAFT_692508 [Bisporella sp. PMI_857]|nr:hypothetical protein B0O99DRAFT_692508 [Bisporella sp. PMI_857]
MHATSSGGIMKAQVKDKIPKRFKELKFGIQSNQQIANQAVLEVSTRVLYDFQDGKKPTAHGANDARMGISSKTGRCETCAGTLNECNGHFGHIRLALPAFHIGYLKLIINILQNICKCCGKVLLTEAQRRQFLRNLRAEGIDNLQRTQICKKINEQCRKAKQCPHCDSINGQIRKVSVLKLVHDKFVTYNKSNAKSKVKPKEYEDFEATFENAKMTNTDLDKHMKRAMEDLHPLRVLNLFKLITPADCELLGINPAEGRPEMFLWQFVPAPPVCIRPSVAQDNASTEDDITTKIAHIVEVNALIKNALVKGQNLQSIMEHWEFLQIQIAMMVNSDVPGLRRDDFGKPIRGFCQRLKGKQGRFRGNLSGKRVDFSGRTVISPDPNLGIDEVAVPVLVAKNLTYPERVTMYNIQKLRACVRNGPDVHPGAQQIVKASSDHKISLKFARRENEARNLKTGDIVERHLEDGDIVLFNRQPSLHKLSIMSHYVKVRPWRTFRLNECVCGPYNADFDGDEMNLHVPQTEEARTEAINLMGVKYNLSTPKNGEPIISATQDFITAAYLLSGKDNFFDRKTFTNLCMYMVNGAEHIDLPPPSIIKPQMLWTGKQVFSVLMRPNQQSDVLVNMEAKCRDFNEDKPKDAGKPAKDQKGTKSTKEMQIAEPVKQNKEESQKYLTHLKSPDMNASDGWLVVQNSEVMCGMMDKTTVGSGKKDSIFYVILRDFGPDAAVKAMNRLAKLSARWLTNQGFSIGISDVYPSNGLLSLKQELVADAYEVCDDLIELHRVGKMEKSAGFDMEQTLEAKLSGKLSDVRGAAGEACYASLSKYNSPLIMAKSGSKGSPINVAQMVALVGQQIINSERVANGFQDRTLPHFPKHSRLPPAKGFVKNSFFSGLRPTEFLMHAMSGREGLVDTAVKTAETGYMSRRLMKSLEDLSVQYDNTVRNSSNIVVQFLFGADNLDPVDMEGDAVPVNFKRTWSHAEALTYNNNDPTLLPFEIDVHCEAMLAKEKAGLKRFKLVDGRELNYKIVDDEDEDIDHLDSTRKFLDTITNHVHDFADRMANLREKLGLPRLSLKEERDKDAEEAIEKAVRKRLTPNADERRIREEIFRDQEALRQAVRRAQVKKLIKQKTKLAENNKRKIEEHMVSQVAKVSQQTLEKFIILCLEKFKKAKTEPGHAVGAVGAQSIGEPGTQMTLKTFHFAGVAGMSITGGVPRIKEIINASKLISTPVIVCPLLGDAGALSAFIVQGQIERTYIGDVLCSVEDHWSGKSANILLAVDGKALSELYLGITIRDIAVSIWRNKKLKIDSSHVHIDDANDIIRIEVHASPGENKTGRGIRTKVSVDEGGSDLLLRINHLKRSLPLIAISGYPETVRAIVIKKSDDKKKDKNALVKRDQNGKEIEEFIHEVHVEGYGLKHCMTTVGVDGTKATTNSIMEVREVLGIEAARTTIALEISKVMSTMNIDPRHMELLADVMTYKGEVLGITRFGLSKMRDSVLQLASFEKTPDHLFEAAAGMKTDKIEGVSECIIMGQTMGVGTGAIQMVVDLKLTVDHLRNGPTLFDDAWKDELRARRKEERDAKAALSGMMEQ